MDSDKQETISNSILVEITIKFTMLIVIYLFTLISCLLAYKRTLNYTNQIKDNLVSFSKALSVMNNDIIEMKNEVKLDE